MLLIPALPLRRSINAEKKSIVLPIGHEDTAKGKKVPWAESLWHRRAVTSIIWVDQSERWWVLTETTCACSPGTWTVVALGNNYKSHKAARHQAGQPAPSHQIFSLFSWNIFIENISPHLKILRGGCVGKLAVDWEIHVGGVIWVLRVTGWKKEKLMLWFILLNRLN